MKLNLNIGCKVVLTEEGARIWNSQYEIVPKKYRLEPKKVGDKLTTQLWCLMETFGPHIHIGMGNIHFKGNNIEIDDFDAVQPN